MLDAEGPKLTRAGLARFADRMHADGLPEIATNAFVRALEFVSSGGATTIPENAIRPVDSLPDLTSLSDFEEEGRAAASKTVVWEVRPLSHS